VAEAEPVRVVTALDDRPRTRAPLPTPYRRWEWHVFEADGWAHLYRVAELRNSRLVMLLPWCLLPAPFPLEHDRASIDPHPLLSPPHGRTCPGCTAHTRAQIPQPRTGTPAAGEFAGDLFQVVTRDART